jgi:hypothetical protein
MNRHLNPWLLLVLLGVAPGALTAGQEPAAQEAAQPAQDRQESAEAPGPDEEGAGEVTQEAAGEDAAPAPNQGPQVISGMSILGNQEAPTSLVIVPWKSSQIGESVGISTMLDDSRQPVDKDVFMRELRFYEIRSETNP